MDTSLYQQYTGICSEQEQRHQKAADLAGKNVLVQADSSALAALQDEENTDIKALADSFGSLTQVPDYESALMELEAGSADAAAMDEGVALTNRPRMTIL